MSDKEKSVPAKREPEQVDEKPRKLIEQEPGDNIQHGRQAQTPDVNPRTNVQPGHRDREQI